MVCLIFKKNGMFNVAIILELSIFISRVFHHKADEKIPNNLNMAWMIRYRDKKDWLVRFC